MHKLCKYRGRHGWESEARKSEVENVIKRLGEENMHMLLIINRTVILNDRYVRGVSKYWCARFSHQSGCRCFIVYLSDN